MPALPPDAMAGLFGKLPARGDFVRENLPRDFTDSWDGWWQRGLADTQARWRDEWDAARLERIQAAFVAAEGPALELGFAPGRVAWWTEGGPRVVARFETGTALPEGSEFATLIDDDWGASAAEPVVLVPRASDAS